MVLVDRSLFERHALHVAPMVLGWWLETEECSGRIVEVEAYSSEEDPGSHAFRRRTPKNDQMFELPGTAYVYFTYGNHWMLNVVAHGPGTAGAVLIRALEPIRGLEPMRLRRPKARSDRDLLSGPGKICAAFGIDRRHNGMDLLSADSALRIVPAECPNRIKTSRRIGLAEGKGDTIPWRFCDADAGCWLSRPA